MGCAITDDVEAGLMPTKATLAFYIGGMGAKDRNFHMELMSRMGFEAEAHHIQELFFEGKRDEAIPLVPTEFADEISLVGSKERIRDRLQAWDDEPGHARSSSTATSTRCARWPSSRRNAIRVAVAELARYRRERWPRRVATCRDRPALVPSAACEKSSSAATTRSRSSGVMRRTTASISRRRLSITSSTRPWPGAVSSITTSRRSSADGLRATSPRRDEPAAHTRHGRRVHVEAFGERAHGLRTLQRHDDQRAELRQRDLVAHRGQRPDGDADQRATRTDDCVDDRFGGFARLFVHRTSTVSRELAAIRGRVAQFEAPHR